MVRSADRFPGDSGVNLTLNLQLAPAATLDPQVLVSPKSLGSLPVKSIPVMSSAVLPVLVKVTVIGELVFPTATLPKFSWLGVNFTSVPVPLRGTLCGLPSALSLNDSVPLTEPAFEGLNVTKVLQLAPAVTLDPQSFVSVKALFVTMAVTFRVALPIFVRVTVCALLAIPTN